MNFFNDVEKIIYRKKTEDPVSLIEYIKFTDEKQKNKCLLFKFKNNLGQILRAITFEVIEFDCHNNKIGKTVFRYNKFEAKGLEVFVPTSKLSVPYETSYVEVRLVNATFETVKYADDEFKAIPYTANDFDKQTKKYQDEDETIKTPKKVVTTPKGSRKTKYKDISSSNKVRAPKVISALLMLAMLGITLYALLFTMNTTASLSDSNFEYTIVNSKEVEITGYIGKGKDVVIPATYKKYSITKIGKEAFASSKITSVTFEGNSIIIDKKAFQKCASLKTVADANGGVTLVNAQAFRNCENLQTISLPNAVIVENAFLDSFAITTLKIGSVESGSFDNLFGSEIPNTLTSVEIKTGHITTSFFGANKSITELILSGNVKVDAGALSTLRIKTLSIGESAKVAPAALKDFTSLTVYLHKNNQYSKEDYSKVNSSLKIKMQ